MVHLLSNKNRDSDFKGLKVTNHLHAHECILSLSADLFGLSIIK